MTSNQMLPLFSSPICVNSYKLDEVEVDMSKKEKYHLNSYSDVDGYMSNDRRVLERYPKLKNVCMKHMESFIFDELKVDKNAKIVTRLSWFNDHPPNHSAHKHCHANSMFSGVLYLDVPENSGAIIFEKPNVNRTIEPNIDEWNIFNCRSWRIEPQNGLCVVFPSHLEHYTEVNNTQQNRYSLAFDMMVLDNRWQ